MSQRAGSTVKEAAGSHSIFLSQPHAVADLIKEAAAGANCYVVRDIVAWIKVLTIDATREIIRQ